jgi:predicted nucleotidyltransferase
MSRGGDFLLKTQNDIFQILRDQKSSLLEGYQVTKIGVFGSYARGEQTNESDLDILVDYQDDRPPTLPKLIELRDYLSELLTIKVDVVTPNGLKARLRDRVLSEVIYL